MGVHDHVHDENCTCGCHEHEHHHEHGEDCGCHEHEHIHAHDEGGIHVEHHMHDEACVVSGSVSVCGEYDKYKSAISSILEAIAARVNELGGFVGHIKASAEAKYTDMFSVTDTDATVRSAPVQDIDIRMASIVFGVTPEDIEPLMEDALRSLKEM